MEAKISALAAVATLIVGVSGATAQEVVNVYNWSDYIDESLLEEFTAETGIEVRYDVFDSNELLETKLLTGGTGYDIVVPSGNFLGRQIQAGVFQKLDFSKLPNAVNIWEDIAQRVAKYDPGNVYSINYMWGTTGLGYNVDKVTALLPEAPLNSWDLLFNPDNAAVLAACGIHVLDAPEEVIPAALNYLGLDGDSSDPADVEKAEAMLTAIRPHVRKFHSSEYINALANGDICLALGWSGDVLQARDRAAEAGNGVDIAYVIPQEGAQMWFDQMAIPADAPNPDGAHAFIDFMMRPQSAAKASNYVYYANGNIASQPLLNEDVIGDTAIYPDEETVSNLFTVSTKDARAQRLFTRTWTRVKSGQ